MYDKEDELVAIKPFERLKRPTDRVSRSELCWLAGLMDGEGSFLITKSKQKKRIIYVTVARIEMTDAFTIKVVESILGRLKIKNTPYPARGRGKGHKDGYILTVTRYVELRKFLGIMLPMLVTKFRQASLLRDFCEIRMEADHRKTRVNGRFTKTYTGIEESYFQAIKKLNRKGK